MRSQLIREHKDDATGIVTITPVDELFDQASVEIHTRREYPLYRVWTRGTNDYFLTPEQCRTIMAMISRAIEILNTLDG